MLAEGCISALRAKVPLSSSSCEIVCGAIFQILSDFTKSFLCMKQNQHGMNKAFNTDLDFFFYVLIAAPTSSSL